MIEIHEPIWRKDTGKRCVGLAEFRLRAEGELTEVRITYRAKKDGKLSYPNPFIVRTDRCYSYPSSWVGGGNVKVYWIPVEDMKEVKNEKNTIETKPKNTNEKQASMQLYGIKENQDENKTEA